MRVEAQKRRALGSESSDVEHELRVVPHSTATAALHGRRHDPFAHGTVGQRGQHRLAAREDEGDQIFPVDPSLPDSFGCGRDLPGFETVELGDVVDHDREIVGVGQEVLLESRIEGRQSLVQLAQFLLLRVIEGGPGDGVLREGALHEVARLGIAVPVIRAKGVELLEQCLYAPVELGIQSNRVGMGR